MSIALEQVSHSQPDGYRELSPMDFMRADHRGRVIDVREPAEFHGELGHIARAELVPLSLLVGRSAGWGRDEEIIVVCRSGKRSSQAARQLASLGFQKVYNLTGGMLAYVAAGLPAVRS
jgi:rhodanese-related sulfurtransferase